MHDAMISEDALNTKCIFKIFTKTLPRVFPHLCEFLHGNRPIR